MLQNLSLQSNLYDTDTTVSVVQIKEVGNGTPKTKRAVRIN